MNLAPPCGLFHLAFSISFHCNAFHRMCPQSIAGLVNVPVLVLSNSASARPPPHVFYVLCLIFIQKEEKMLILYVHLLCLASISQHETTILLSCGGFQPKSQKDRLTLLSCFLFPHYTLQTKFSLLFIDLKNTVPLLDVFLWVWWARGSGDVRTHTVYLVDLLLWYWMSAKYTVSIHVEYWFLILQIFYTMCCTSVGEWGRKSQEDRLTLLL